MSRSPSRPAGLGVLALLALAFPASQGCSAREAGAETRVHLTPEEAAAAREAEAAARKERALATAETARRWTAAGLDYAGRAARAAAGWAREYGPQVTAVAREYGPKVAATVKGVYQEYGPAVGAVVKEVYQTVGPVVGRGLERVAKEYGPAAARAGKDFLVSAGRFTRDEVAPVAGGLMVGALRGLDDATGASAAVKARFRGALDRLGRLPVSLGGRRGTLDEVAPEALRRDAGAEASEGAGGDAAGAWLGFADDAAIEELVFGDLGVSLGAAARGEGGVGPVLAARIRRALADRSAWRDAAARGEAGAPSWLQELTDAVAGAARAGAARAGAGGP